MQVPADELQKYTDFAVQVARRLRAIDIHPEQLLWHYTDGHGLLGIMESQSIYSTQVSCLNDASEIRYASLIFREALKRLSEAQAGNAETTFLVDAIQYFAEDPTTPNHVALPYFVTCFSEIRDDLSQWRAYGGGENGYAIGFKAKHLIGTQGSYLARVTYYKPAHDQPLANDVAAATVEFYKDGFAKFGNGDLPAWTDAFLSQWDLAITQVAPLIKSAGFQSENECRLCRTYRNDDLQNMTFKQKGTMLARHLPIRPGPIGTAAYRLPISEILIGPCRHPHVSRISVGTLLQKWGYDPAIVRLSDIPFQLT